MKVNSAGDNFTYLKQGIHRGDLKGHGYGRSSRDMKGTADRIEISGEALARFLRDRSIIDNKEDVIKHAKDRIEVHVITDLTGSDFTEPSRQERVRALKELVGSGRYDFDDGGTLKSVSEALLSALMR